MEIRLSDRLRPDSEAAPWVIEEVKKLEAENARLRKALQRIADGDVAPSSIKGYIDEAYQQIARKELLEK